MPSQPNRQASRKTIAPRPSNWYPDPSLNLRVETMTFRVIERFGVASRYNWHVTRHPTLDAARKVAAASAVDFLIEDDYGKPVEYRIA